MGAQSYFTVAKGRTVTDAYRAAMESARAQNGHQDGYSGDIQTSDGFREIPKVYVKGLNTATRVALLDAVVDGERPRGLGVRAGRAWTILKSYGADKRGAALALELPGGRWAFAGLGAS